MAVGGLFLIVGIHVKPKYCDYHRHNIICALQEFHENPSFPDSFEVRKGSNRLNFNV